MIIPPDCTGDINNYTLGYYTDDLWLAIRLNVAGGNAKFVPLILFSEHEPGRLRVLVPSIFSPGLRVSGTITPVSTPAGSFMANWWYASAHGTVKMSTNVPVIQIGGANLTAATNANGDLAQLFGGPTLAFPIVQQFNQFRSATLNVQLIQP